MTDFSALTESVNQQVSNITQSASKFSGEPIVVDIGKPGGKKKLEEAKKKVQAFSDGLERQMKTLKNKITKNLNKTYDQAMDSMEPYKSLIDLISGIAAPSADPSALLATLTGVLDVLDKLKEHYTQQYLGPVETVVNVISTTAELSSSLSALSSVSMPEIQVVETKTEFKKTTDSNTGEVTITEVTKTEPVETISVSPPSPPSISIGDVASGQEEEEKPAQEEPVKRIVLGFNNYNLLTSTVRSNASLYKLARQRRVFTVFKIDGYCSRRFYELVSTPYGYNITMEYPSLQCTFRSLEQALNYNGYNKTDKFPPVNTTFYVNPSIQNASASSGDTWLKDPTEAYVVSVVPDTDFEIVPSLPNFIRKNKKWINTETNEEDRPWRFNDRFFVKSAEDATEEQREEDMKNIWYIDVYEGEGWQWRSRPRVSEVQFKKYTIESVSQPEIEKVMVNVREEQYAGEWDG